MKRIITGTKATEKDADKTEAVKRKTEKEKEVEINDKILVGVTSEKEDDSNDSINSIREVVFSILILLPRGTILPPARPIVRPITLEVGTARKRLFILVYRTPEKPRDAPVVPITPLDTITREVSPVTISPPAPTEIPTSTALVRLNERERRAGKNAAYLEVMAIERGRGRGRRGHGGQA
jgi:hypothetical protein